MVRTNTTLVALCAIFALVLTFGNALAQPDEWDQDRIDAWFNVPNTELPFDDDPDGYWIQGDIQIPSDDVNVVDGEAYTVVFEAGANIIFSVDDQGNAGGSLTMRVSTDAGDDHGIGCIQVQGGPGEDMVTMDGVIVEEVQMNWGGIVILTDPSDDLLDDWQDRFASGNNISYCHILNASDGQAATAIVLDDAQVWVHNCHFNAQGDNYNAFLTINHGLYAFQSNYIEGAVATAISCNGALDDAAGGLEGNLLSQVVSNNHVTSATGDGIQVFEGFNGAVRNNILVDIQNLAIFVDNSADAIVCNNCIVGGSEFENVGIRILTAWCEVSNNIFVDLTVGVNGDNANGDVDYCLFNDIDDEFAGGADRGVDCQLDTDPEFVNDDPEDFHLLYTSPAIDAGVPDEDYNDPDDSLNDTSSRFAMKPVFVSQ